jgi:hypothetical protein
VRMNRGERSSAPFTSPSTAPDSAGGLRTIRVTHPFHPWRGREFVFVVARRTWGQDRVFFVDKGGVQRSLPRAWTDAARRGSVRRVGGWSLPVTGRGSVGGRGGGGWFARSAPVIGIPPYLARGFCRSAFGASGWLSAFVSVTAKVGGNFEEFEPFRPDAAAELVEASASPADYRKG